MARYIVLIHRVNTYCLTSLAFFCASSSVNESEPTAGSFQTNQKIQLNVLGKCNASTGRGSFKIRLWNKRIIFKKKGIHILIFKYFIRDRKYDIVLKMNDMLLKWYCILHCRLVAPKLLVKVGSQCASSSFV